MGLAGQGALRRLLDAHGKWPRAGLIHGYQGHADDLPADVYIQWQRHCLAAMMRLLRHDGAIFYNHKWRVQAGLLQDRSEIVEGFPVRQIIIWKRDGGINFNPGYLLPTYEVIYLIAQPAFRLRPKANAIGDVWRIPQESRNPSPRSLPGGTGSKVHPGYQCRDRARSLSRIGHHGHCRESL